MTRKMKTASILIILTVLTSLFTACDNQKGTATASGAIPTEKPLNVTEDLNAVNLKSANVYSGSVYEVGDFIYFADKNYDIYKYNTVTREKSLVIDLNSKVTESFNVKGDMIYFIAYLTDAKAAEKEISSVYSVNTDGSGMKKLIDNSLNLVILNNDAYYRNTEDSLLYKYDLTTGDSMKVLENKIESYDIVSGKLYCIESAGTENTHEVNISVYDLYTKEKKVLLTSVGMNSSKSNNPVVSSLQFYNGYLYFMENISIRKYNPETAEIETIAVNPTAQNLFMLGLHVSSKGIYFYSWSMDDATKTMSSHIYKVDSKVLEICRLDNTQIIALNLTKDYMITDVIDLNLKSRIKRIFNYSGQEVQLDW
jgi:hypothetical protein